MPLAAVTNVLVPNVDTGNVMAGNIEEFITRPSFVRLTAVTSLAPLGTAITATTVRLLIGRTVLVNGQQLSGVGTAINLKDHIQAEHGALRGRIFLSFVSGGAPVVIWRLDIIPMA